MSAQKKDEALASASRDAQQIAQAIRNYFVGLFSEYGEVESTYHAQTEPNPTRTTADFVIKTPGGPVSRIKCHLEFFHGA